MANTRSRNYPAISLGEAISRAATLYKSEGRARTDAKSAVLAWGYGSLNGSSLRVLSALRQYGLIEGGNEDVRLSAVALTLLVEPQSSPDYTEALRTALVAPALFQEMLAEYGDNLPSDPALISYLVRKQSFGEQAAKSLIESFRESVELVRAAGASYTPPVALANVVSIERPSDSVKTMQQNDLLTTVAPAKLSVSYPLSVDTVLTLTITGKVPTVKQLRNLDRMLELGKDQLLQAVEDAQEAEAAETADYVVT